MRDPLVAWTPTGCMLRMPAASGNGRRDRYDGRSASCGRHARPDAAHRHWFFLAHDCNHLRQLARLTGLRLVDVSCGGATARNILEGGPFFHRPQIHAVGPSAKLATITIGGNDVNYIGDLGLLAY